MTQQKYNNWQLTTDADNILWLTLDRQGTSVNSLSRDVFTELDAIIKHISNETYVGVAIQSGKKKGFIAGADVTQFTTLKSLDEAYDFIRQAQITLDKLEALNIPTIAVIKGFCLGGGTELALACRYRVAAETDDTVIGLPEVKIGVHPGWGGTVRLPKLIGAIAAMQIMLPGAAYPARKAAKIGMVDAAVPERELKRAVRYYLLQHPKPHSPTLLQKLSNLPGIRSLLGKIFTQKLIKENVKREFYPAPYAIIDNWVRDGGDGNAMVNEAKSIAEMMLTPTARNLLRAFFLQERMKGLGKKVPFKLQHVHVIGAGTMGGDIAAWCAYKGYYVTLQDRGPEYIAPAIKRAYKLFSKKLKEPRLIQAAMDRLQADVTGRGISRADVVIEAAFENLQVKQEIFKSIESQMKSGAIMATNTSSIPLEEIAAVLKNPARLVGIHFFNPVAKMPLVEIVRSDKTGDDVVQRAAAFAGAIGRLPLPVMSKPGFLVNRVLMPYLMEAMFMLQEGYSPAEIDRAALDFGMPMGPIALADKVGLDVCLSVAKNLTAHFGGEVPKRLETMVAAGDLGEKSGKGFYVYRNGKKEHDATSELKEARNKEENNTEDLTDRLILIMVNEAVTCLHEGIIIDSDLLDAGLIFGTGFAPFRGGPIQYAQTRGVGDTVAALIKLQATHGSRFAPKPGWKELSHGGTPGNGGDLSHHELQHVSVISKKTQDPGSSSHHTEN